MRPVGVKVSVPGNPEIAVAELRGAPLLCVALLSRWRRPATRPQSIMPLKGVELEVVEGITEHSSRVALKGVFQNFGDVVSCWVPPVDRRGTDKASVRFANAQAAEAAKEACDAGQVFLQGMMVKANWRSGGGRRVGNSDLGELSKANDFEDGGMRQFAIMDRRPPPPRPRESQRERERDRERDRPRRTLRRASSGRQQNAEVAPGKGAAAPAAEAAPDGESELRAGSRRAERKSVADPENVVASELSFEGSTEPLGPSYHPSIFVSAGRDAMTDARTSEAQTRRPLRPLSAVVVCTAVAGLLGAAFVGSASPTLREAPDVESSVTMGTRARMWQAGRPNKAMIRSRKGKMPSLNNMKDQYFIVYARSPKIKEWKPLNIVSGSEAMKTLKSATDNRIAKTVGADKLAEGQVVKGIGMQLYKQKDEIFDQAKQMHPGLSYTQEIQFGFKEIKNNTQFNDNPGSFMDMRGIELIPPEEELRNLLDAAGEAVEEAQVQALQKQSAYGFTDCAPGLQAFWI
eukprot:s1194_g20.t1